MVSKTVGGGPLGFGGTGGTSRLLVKMGTVGVAGSFGVDKGTLDEDEVGLRPKSPLFLSLGDATPLSCGLSKGLPVLTARGLLGLGDDLGLLGSPGPGASGAMGAGASG